MPNALDQVVAAAVSVIEQLRAIYESGLPSEQRHEQFKHVASRGIKFIEITAQRERACPVPKTD